MMLAVTTKIRNLYTWKKFANLVPLEHHLSICGPLKDLVDPSLEIFRVDINGIATNVQAQCQNMA